jgi:hypothetical protein
MIDQVAPAHEPAGRGAPGPAPHDVATVGIVVTTYNHARFLEEALASVVADCDGPAFERWIGAGCID